MLVECPCTCIRCGYFWVDGNKCWAASYPSAISFLNSYLSLQLLLTIQEKQHLTFKAAPEILEHTQSCLYQRQADLTRQTSFTLAKERNWRKRIDASTAVAKNHFFAFAVKLYWTSGIHLALWPVPSLACTKCHRPFLFIQQGNSLLCFGEDSLLGWHLQGVTFPAYLSWVDNKLMII